MLIFVVRGQQWNSLGIPMVLEGISYCFNNNNNMGAYIALLK